MSDSELYSFIITATIVVLAFFIVYCCNKYDSSINNYIQENWSIISIRNLDMKVVLRFRANRGRKYITILSYLDDKERCHAMESYSFYKNCKVGQIITIQEIIYLTNDSEYKKEIRLATENDYEKLNSCEQKYKENFLKIKDIESIKYIKRPNAAGFVTTILGCILFIGIIFVYILFYDKLK